MGIKDQLMTTGGPPIVTVHTHTYIYIYKTKTKQLKPMNI